MKLCELSSCICRYEDNFDAVNNVLVIIEPTSGNSIESLGAPDKFLQDRAYLFGQQSFAGELSSICMGF